MAIRKWTSMTLIAAMSLSSAGLSAQGLSPLTGAGAIDPAEPRLKLPPLPRRTDGPAGGGMTPFRTGETMTGVDRSAFPGMTCPLIDNRPYKDLLQSIQALSRVVVVTPECQNNADVVKMNEEVKKLLSSGTSLQTLWASPESIASDPKALADFQANLTVMITGINRVTETLQSNALINDKCGRQMLTGTGILVAVSDLISSFAPFALIGASMNPSLGVALPYILGFTGVGSVAKIIKNLHDQNTLDMSKPEHRQAIMQNICEFSKINQRVRFLKLAQTGQLEKVTEEIQQMRKDTYSALRGRFSERALSIAGIRTSYAQVLSRAAQTLKLDTAEIQGLMAQVAESKDDHLTCFMAREVIEKAGDESGFPLRAVGNFKTLLANQENPSVAQTAILRAEERLRDHLKSLAAAGAEKAISECAAAGRAYFESLSRIVQTTGTTLTKLTASLDRQLGQDPEYAQYRKNELAAQAETETLAKVANILEQLNLDNAILDKVEMDTQMRGLKQALFGTPGGLPLLRGSSPAMAWLSFVDEQFARSVSAFDTEIQSLVQDSYMITRTGRNDFVRRNEKGEPVLDRYGHPIKLSITQQHETIFSDVRMSQELGNITTRIAPVGSDNQRVICQRLENVWLSWAAAMDHLAAQNFFCQNIQGFFDSSTEPALVRHCSGRRDLAGKVLVPSTIEQKKSRLVEKGFRDRAQLINAKMKELICQMPDASSMK